VILGRGYITLEYKTTFCDWKTYKNENSSRFAKIEKMGTTDTI
jgi:hypothetical protein